MTVCCHVTDDRVREIMSLSSFTVKAHEPLFCTWLFVLSRDWWPWGGRHFSSVTRLKTAKAVVKPFMHYCLERLWMKNWLWMANKLKMSCRLVLVMRYWKYGIVGGYLVWFRRENYLHWVKIVCFSPDLLVVYDIIAFRRKSGQHIDCTFNERQ